MGCVVQRLGHDVQPIQADKPEQAITQIFLLDQQEDAKNQDDAENSGRPQERLDQIAHILQFIGRLFDYLHGLRSVGTVRAYWRSAGSRYAGELLCDVSDAGGSAPQRTVPRRPHRVQFVMDILLIARQFVGDTDQLIKDHPSDGAGGRDGHQHHQRHGGNPAQM